MLLMVFASGYSLGVAEDCRASVPESFLDKGGLLKPQRCLTIVGMNINPPDIPPGAITRLDAFLLGRFAVAIDGVELAGDRWPSLRSAQRVQLLCLQPRQRLHASHGSGQFGSSCTAPR